MNMEDQELLKEILNIPSESKTIEFKRLGNSNTGVVKKVCQTIVAMANTSGGYIVLGVNDPERNDLKGEDRIFGIEENRNNYDEIKRDISKISPSIAPQFREIQTSSGKTVALIMIKKAEENFHQINNEVFVRLEKGNHKLTPHEINELSYSKGFKRADNELVHVDMNLLKTEYYKEWRDKEMPSKSRENIDAVLESKGLARKDENGDLQPTRAAVMLFAEYPTSLMETRCAIKVMVYDGNEEIFGETPNIIKKGLLGGAIPQLIREAHKYVLEQITSGLTVKSGFENLHKIPERAVKEAITNAVIHRDYHAKLDIEIKIFKNRIEIWNAGLFPSNITPQNIGRVRATSYRNDLLVKTLREFPSPPNLDQNEGVRAMQAEMDRYNLFQPIFKTCPLQSREIPDSVCLTLQNEEISEEWKKMKTYLEQNKHINNKTARETVGIQITSQMSYLLKKWVDMGLLLPIVKNPGDKKNVLYKMPKTSDFDEL